MRFASRDMIHDRALYRLAVHKELAGTRGSKFLFWAFALYFSQVRGSFLLLCSDDTYLVAYLSPFSLFLVNVCTQTGQLLFSQVRSTCGHESIN